MESTSFTVEDNVTITAPSKVGYDFSGWTWTTGGRTGNTNANYTGFSAGEVTADLTLKANWTVHEWTLTFDGNGGAWNSGTSTVIKRTVPYNTVIDPDARDMLNGSNPVFLATATLASSDYDFDGWEGWTEGMTMPDENVTLRAKWKAHEYRITYTYDPALEEDEVPVNPNPTTFTVETETFTLVDPTRNAYDLEGWGGDRKPSNKISVGKGEYHSDIVLNSYWTAKQYTVTFDGNGGTWSWTDAEGRPVVVSEIVRENIPYGSSFGALSLPNPDPVRAGYTFRGWEGLDLTDTMPNEPVTFKATWTADYNHIYFHTYGGSTIDPIDADTDTPITAPADPVWEGYEFGGWYLDDAGTQPLGEFPTTMPAGGLDLYAKWNAVEYTITYNLDGGALPEGRVNPATYTILSGDLAIYKPERTGYDFAGWTGTDLDKAKVSLTIPAGSTGDREYTATWNAKTVHVGFRLNYTGAPATTWVDYKYDEVVVRPDDPERTGYTFDGWYTDAEGKNPFDFSTTLNSENVSFNSNWEFNLYAKWNIITYTVTFDTDGAGTIDPQAVQYNNLATQPAEPKKVGYTFDGWYVLNDKGEMVSQFSFSTPITADLNLKAKWTGLPITTIWENNGEYLDKYDQHVGDTFRPYTFRSLPHRDGYRLDEEHLWDPDIPEIVPYIKSQVQIYHLNWIKLLTVYFVNDGKVIKQLYVDENSALEGNPGVPQLTKPGMKLVWTLDDAEYDMSAPVVEDNITLVATFVEGEDYSDYATISPSLALEENINMNAYVKIKEGTDPSDYSVIATFEGNTTMEGTLADLATYSRGEYKLSDIAVVAAPQMNEPVTVTISYKGNDVLTKDLTVRGYAEDWIQRDYSEELTNLLIALLDFGAYSQLQFNYDTTNLANSKYSSGIVPSTVVPTFEVRTEGSVSGITGSKIALTLVSDTTMNMYFSAAKKASFQFKIDGKEAPATYSKKEYKVALPNIAVAELGDTHAFTVTGGNATMTVTAAPLAYAYQHQNDSGDLGNVCKAVYLYYLAAVAYFG